MKELKITATTEQEFKEQAYAIANSVNTTDELAEFVNFISSYPLDYGSVVYAQCAAMLATQRVMDLGEQGGITGFQAGFIGWEMVRNFMSVGDCGLTIIDWEKMLYPQYKYRFETTISGKTFEKLQEKAKERLAEEDKSDEDVPPMHPEVRRHMESIVSGVVPFGYRMFQDVAREQDRERIEKQRRERLGIPETPVYEIRMRPDFPELFIPSEPRIKVSPYSKFDKYHKKNRKRK